jgi:hypothetical protein
MERERLNIYKANTKENRHYKDYFCTCRRDGTPNPFGIVNYMTSAYYRAREQYVDNLTKRQQRAVNLIRIMDNGAWVEGLGGWIGGINGPAYILDC